MSQVVWSIKSKTILLIFFIFDTYLIPKFKL